MQENSVDYPNLTQDQVDTYQDDTEYLDYINQRASKMQEVKGDLWDIECDAVCITTNGFVKKNGECVMGKGCAKQAADYWPSLPATLGKMIRMGGNRVHQLFSVEGVSIIALPVKCEGFEFQNELDCEQIVKHMRYKFKPKQYVPGWACIAELSVIKHSANQLVNMANQNAWEKVLIPRLGCGAGELSWGDVKPVLDRILDDRFYAVTFK